MTVETDRLISLIEFAQQSARMSAKPVTSVSEHGQFVRHEHQLLGLPGIQLNVTASEGESETWLQVERLHETRPPHPGNELLPWIAITQSPSDEPQLRTRVTGAALIAAGTHIAVGSPEDGDADGRDLVSPEEDYPLDEYFRGGEIRELFRSFVDEAWRPWAVEEDKSRQTIKLYSQLFTLKQQLEGGMVDAPLELVWGVGLT